MVLLVIPELYKGTDEDDKYSPKINGTVDMILLVFDFEISSWPE